MQNDKILALCLAYFAIICTFDLKPRDSALTFDPGKDRFGDQVMTYIRAKYIAARDDINLLIPEFMHADQLALYQHETLLTPSKKSVFSKIIHIKKARKEFKKHQNTLFIIPFDIQIDEWKSFDNMYFTCKKNIQFSHELKKLIKPITEVTPLQIPTHVVATIAVHVRKGGGFDAPLLSDITANKKTNARVFADKIWPTKFPPDEFYIEQINYISNILNNPPLYVHIFTDDRNPQALAHKYKQDVGKGNIEFGYRETDNCYDAHILEDLFNMASCDYLIRPQSSYSRVAQLIGDHKLIISPLQAYWKQRKLIINKISRVRPPCKKN